MGCIQALLMVAGCYIVVSAINRVWAGSGSTLDQVICYGALICLVAIILFFAWIAHRESVAAEAEKQQWVKRCISAEVAIVGRHPSSSADDDYGYHESPAYQELAMSPLQRAASRTETTVLVRTSDADLERLKARKAIRIYYWPETPFTFLLEDEI